MMVNSLEAQNYYNFINVTSRCIYFFFIMTLIMK